MNAHYVCIKLDREERPDLDDIYMTALSMMGEQGGWPLDHVSSTPDGVPFWGGTYFPKTPQYGRPGFMQILQELARVYGTTTAAVLPKMRAQLTEGARPPAFAGASRRGGSMANCRPVCPPRAARSLAAHIDMNQRWHARRSTQSFPNPFFYRFLCASKHSLRR